MKYALGNMLNGAGGFNPDGLSLDLQFATDKTLTARKGPTPVFNRASTGTFIGSNGLIQSAAVDAARFDHDPITRACNGLLIEESRANFVSFSDAFNDESWGKAGIGISAPVVTANQGTAPDGQNTADRIVFAASTAAEQQGHVWKVAAGGNKNAGSSVTASVWLRTETGTTTVYLSVTQTPTGGTYTACSVTTTWTRFKVTRTLTSTTSVYIEIGPDTRVSFANQPPALGATVLVWGAQLEAGAFPTSYIPTTIGSVVRSADVCSIAGGDFTGIYNQTEGSVLVDAFTPASGSRIIVSTDNNGTTEVNRIFTNGTLSAVEVVDGTLQSQVLPGGIVANTAFKLASAYKLNDFAASRNGAAPQTDNTGTLPTPNQLKIGYEKNGNFMCGCVSSLRYYKKRLPNAKLQSLTA